MNNINNLNLPTEEVLNISLKDSEARTQKIATKVREANGSLTPAQRQRNLDRAALIDNLIDFDAEDKDSMYYEAVLTTRDMHKDAYGYRGSVSVGHTYCATVDDYKQAYIEAWFELRQSAIEAYEVEVAADAAAWKEHRKAIEACGFSGTKLQQLRKYVEQTIPAVSESPDDFFTDSGEISPCGYLEYVMRIGSATPSMVAWLNS